MLKNFLKRCKWHSVLGNIFRVYYFTLMTLWKLCYFFLSQWIDFYKCLCLDINVPSCCLLGVDLVIFFLNAWRKCLNFFFFFLGSRARTAFMSCWICVLFYILQPEELLLWMLSKPHSIFTIFKTNETTFSLILESMKYDFNLICWWHGTV